MSEKKKPLFQRCGSVSHVHSVCGVRPNEDGDIDLSGVEGIGGGGSGGMVAVAFNNYSAQGQYQHVGATFEEVLGAIDNGVYVTACLYTNNNGTRTQWPLTRATVSSNREYIMFSDNANSVDYVYNSDGSFHKFEPEE